MDKTLQQEMEDMALDKVQLASLPPFLYKGDTDSLSELNRRLYELEAELRAYKWSFDAVTVLNILLIILLIVGTL
jgi:hypothetical protein